MITFWCCCWNKLLTAKKQRFKLHGIHFLLWWLFLVFISLSLLWRILVPIICFTLMLILKAIMRSVLKVFLRLWFAGNMYHCFVRISLKFGNARLYVTDNGMHCSSWSFSWWSCFRLSWSTFWICRIATSLLYPLLKNYSISFVEWQS